MDLVVDVLLVLGLVGEAVCVVGLLSARTAIDKLHYSGAATTVPVFLVAAAVVVEEGATSSSANVVVTALLVLVLGAVLNHFTARIARGRGDDK